MLNVLGESKWETKCKVSLEFHGEKMVTLLLKNLPNSTFMK